MNYGEFLRKLRPYCINKTIKNEELVNGPIEVIIETAKIKKEKGSSKGEPLYYEITEASKIVNGKLDIPRIRDALRYDGMENKVISSIEAFCDDYIDRNKTGDLIDEYLTVAESDPSFSKSEISRIKEATNDPALFLALILIKSLKEPNLNQEKTETVVWTKGNNYIKVIKGDIFSYIFGKKASTKRIAVIPVNTSFDVHVSTKLEKENRPLVSANTLHGEFLLRMYKSGIAETELKRRITDNLELNEIINEITKTIDTPIGSIATLEVGNATVYLLAISKFDQKNNARSSKQDVKTALLKLIDYYDEKGLGYDLYVPLMGTGMSRAKLDHQEAFDLMCNTLLESGKFVQGKINIVIETEVYEFLNIEKGRKQ